MMRCAAWLSLLFFCTGCGQPVSPFPSHDEQFQRKYVLPPPLHSTADPVESRALSAEPAPGHGPHSPGDRFASLPESGFVHVADQPLSTFSIDVDTASYTKARMYLLERGALPPPDAVRIEEFVNYFDYDYADDQRETPLAVHLEAATAPWLPAHRLIRVGLKARQLQNERPACNLVFLVDVSGSMDYPNKLPLVKESLRLLTGQLQARDRVSLVVYAGAAGCVLPPTPGDQQVTIKNAVARLEAGGSTNGGQGIELAYCLARDTAIEGGVNRVLLCTDGDFNVGTTSPGALVRFAEEQADHGIYLSVLGFGLGNHNDLLLEELSNKADGNYAFIDHADEARKVLVDQMQATLVPVAADVKLQIEFNPARVAAYRLLGYENRRLRSADFNDDRIDAGECGAGHRVTALYEVIPAESSSVRPSVDPLKYQSARERAPSAQPLELLTLKLRYKEPATETSRLITRALIDQDTAFSAASSDFRFAAAVAGFGLLLRQSPYRGDISYDAVREIAAGACGTDPGGHRAEFLRMVEVAGQLTQPAADTRLSHRKW